MANFFLFSRCSNERCIARVEFTDPLILRVHQSSTRRVNLLSNVEKPVELYDFGI